MPGVGKSLSVQVSTGLKMLDFVIFFDDLEQVFLTSTTFCELAHNDVIDKTWNVPTALLHDTFTYLTTPRNPLCKQNKEGQIGPNGSAIISLRTFPSEIVRLDPSHRLKVRIFRMENPQQWIIGIVSVRFFYFSTFNLTS